MPPNSRISDIGVGVCAIDGPMTGVLVTGSPNVDIENSPGSRLTDIVLAYCGHIGIMVVGSSTTDTNANLSTSRIGDPFAGVFSGILVTGASKTDTGG